ncbi:MAG: hypothetical protein IJV00_08940 [Clostridia bacterium]|nr:hypothetical protein [Clostridia bacterium]
MAENALAEKKLELDTKKTENDIRLNNYRSQKALDDLRSNYEAEIAELENAVSELQNGEYQVPDRYIPDNKPDEAYRSILNSANRMAGGGWGATADSKAYREFVERALDEIMNDPYLDENYKRTIRFYARSDGYLL